MDSEEIEGNGIDNLLKSQVATSKKVRKGSKTQASGTVRVKSGCFCCRKRKKKCDELRPACSGCKRNYFKCVYPSNPKQILPRDFEIESESYVKYESATQATFELKNNESNALVLTNSEESIEQFIDLSDCSPTAAAPTVSLSAFSLAGFSQWVPNVYMNEVESELYFHFIHRFMPAVSPTYSDPRLSPQQIWIPLASHSEILREVYFSCGASQLAYRFPEYQKLSVERYNKSVRMISDEISNKRIDGTEDWLLAAILSLCLRDRAAGYNGSRCAQHLVAAYKIIKERERKKLSQLSSIDISSSNGEITIDSEFFKVEPNERTLVESFIFNYSIVIFTCSYDNLVKLPSPFGVFPEMASWINAPLYEDVTVTWMNHPILGSSVEEFEVISKLSWLLRFHYCIQPTDPNYINEDLFWKLITALKLNLDSMEVNLANKNEGIDLEDIDSTLRTSLLISSVLFHASKILFQKLVNPSLSASFVSVQDSVAEILKACLSIPPNDHSACTCVLGIFIAGAAAITEVDKQLVSKILVDLSDLLFSNFGLNVLGILQRSWNREQEEEVLNGSSGYKSFDLLFDRDEVEVISF